MNIAIITCLGECFGDVVLVIVILMVLERLRRINLEEVCKESNIEKRKIGVVTNTCDPIQPPSIFQMLFPYIKKQEKSD